MEASHLRELQRPLKQQYRDEPASAVVPARGEVVVDVPGLTCTVVGRDIIAGLHPAAGGPAGSACSADLILEALAACAGVTLAAVATSMSMPLRSARVVAEGHWDARGTLGVDREAPIGLTDVAVRFELDTDADPATIARLVELVERYCVIAQTLAHPPVVTFAHELVAIGPMP